VHPFGMHHSIYTSFSYNKIAKILLGSNPYINKISFHSTNSSNIQFSKKTQSIASIQFGHYTKEVKKLVFYLKINESFSSKHYHHKLK